MVDAVAWIHDQAGEGRVGTTGWIDKHPRTGVDQAHLLLYPVRHGVADTMRVLAQLMGLARADAGRMVEVAPDTTHLQLQDGQLTLHFGDTATTSRITAPDWDATALATHTAVLTIGTDGWQGHTLDTYPSRPQRLWTGLVRLVDHTTTMGDQ